MVLDQKYCRFGNFPGTLFSLIFAISRPREFKVLANIENTGFLDGFLVN